MQNPEDGAESLSVVDESGAPALPDPSLVVPEREPTKGVDEAPLKKVAAPPNSYAIRLLCVLAVFGCLIYAQDLFFPLLLAALLSAVLSGPVRWLERKHLPRALGAAFLILALITTGGYSMAQLQEPAQEWMKQAPKTLRKLDRRLRQFREPVQMVTEAAGEVEKLTRLSGTSAAQSPTSKPSMGDSLISGASGLLLTTAVTIVLIYLFLVFGDRVLLRLLEFFPSVRTVGDAGRISGRISREVSRYLWTITTINISLGIAVGVAMTLLGMPNPWLWGAMAGLFNFVPYLGALTAATVIFLVSLVTFPEVGRALVPPIVFLVLTGLEGNLLTPVVLGRRFSLNPAIVFVWLFLWGWMWGVGGALIAIPLLASLKIMSDLLPSLRRLGVLLGR